MGTFLVEGPADAPWTIALAHGAGAGMRTPFMAAFSEGLAARGLRIVRFEFPYMAARKTGGRSAPDREPVLRRAWLDVIDSLGRNRLVIGGKSMGGRIASMVADEAGVAGLICLGYPFHPPAKLNQLRTVHLRNLKTPALICQGERDTFGTKDEVAKYSLSDAIQIHWLADGDHSFKPRKQSGMTERGNWNGAMEAIERFLSGMSAS